MHFPKDSAKNFPDPLGPKDYKLKREELASYQFISKAGQNISPFAVSRCWCYNCLDATDSFADRLAQCRQNRFTFKTLQIKCRRKKEEVQDTGASAPLQIAIPTPAHPVPEYP